MKNVFFFHFKIEGQGVGSTKEEAWEDFLESFFQDPGACPEDAKKGERVL